MRSIEATLALDYFRRGILFIPLVLLVMIALPLWLFAALDSDGSLLPNSREAVVLHVTLTLVMGFGAAVAVFQALGKLPRFFVRPISAVRLVACQMGLGMMTVAAMYVCAASLINLRGVHWPVIGPAMFIATNLACAIAMIWSLEGSVLGQLFGCTATSVPMVIWFNRCYGARVMGDWKVMWHEPTAAEALTLLGISAAAFVVAIAGVARTRRGDVWNFSALYEWWDRQTSSRAPATFRSPFAGQAWCEWQQKLGWMPTSLVAGVLLLPGGAWLAGRIETRPMLDFMLGMPIVLLAVVTPLVYGLVLGNCSKDGNGMKQTMSTRPVTDSFLAQSLLRTCATSLLLAWATWLVGLATFTGLAYLAGFRTEVANGFTLTGLRTYPEMFYLALAFSLLPLTSWTLTALVAALVATGRPWFLVGVLAIFFIVGPGVAMIHHYVPEFLIEGFIALVGILYLIGTIWAFVAAFRRRLIGVPTVVCSAVAFLVMTGTMFFARMPALDGDPEWLCHFTGFCALTVLPLAAMPLAVSWNRHR